MSIHASLAARPIDAAALPVVDVSDLSSSDPARRRAVGDALKRACLDKGFFYCAGHGVPQGLIEAMLAQTRAFFDEPVEKKLAIEKSLSRCNRGYEVLGGQRLEAGAPPDRKEGFYIGVELPEDDPRVAAGRFNRGPNQWPSDLPGFRPAMVAYFAALQELGTRLMRGLALSLDLDEDAFAAYCRDSLSTLRLLHYPPQRADAAQGEKGAGAHTDFGGLTILLQDEVGGLQVYDNDAESWIQAAPIPGTYVCNLGDLIQRWTNRRYRSNLHRVVNISGRERYSIPFFHVGNPDYTVRCIRTCLKEGDVPLYPPITVEEHLQAMYRKTYA